MSGDGGSGRLVQVIVSLVTAGYYNRRGPRRSVALRTIPKRARDLGLDTTRPRSTASAGPIYTYTGEGPQAGRVDWQGSSGTEFTVVCRTRDVGQLVVDGIERGSLDDTEQIIDPTVREEVEIALRAVSAEMAIWAEGDHRLG